MLPVHTHTAPGSSLEAALPVLACVALGVGYVLLARRRRREPPSGLG